jgi:hypothetical protein
LQLGVEAEFDHYGSGYASYVHVFCAKAGGRSRTRRACEDSIDGIAVYLSRLAPFAIYGREQRTKSASGSSMQYLGLADVYSLPPGNWEAEISAVLQVLEGFNFVLPARAQLVEALPYKLDIATIFDDTHVFDAIFYWED